MLLTLREKPTHSLTP